MGPIAGMTVNIVTVAWLIFAIVFSFPYYMLVTGMLSLPLSGWWCLPINIASNMNYTCACVGKFLVIEGVWWVVAGEKYSRSMQKAREGGEQVQK